MVLEKLLEAFTELKKKRNAKISAEDLKSFNEAKEEVWTEFIENINENILRVKEKVKDLGDFEKDGLDNLFNKRLDKEGISKIIKVINRKIDVDNESPESKHNYRQIELLKQLLSDDFLKPAIVLQALDDSAKKLPNATPRSWLFRKVTEYSGGFVGGVLGSIGGAISGALAGGIVAGTLVFLGGSIGLGLATGGIGPILLAGVIGVGALAGGMYGAKSDSAEGFAKGFDFMSSKHTQSCVDHIAALVENLKKITPIPTANDNIESNPSTKPSPTQLRSFTNISSKSINEPTNELSNELLINKLINKLIDALNNRTPNISEAMQAWDSLKEHRDKIDEKLYTSLQQSYNEVVPLVSNGMDRPTLNLDSKNPKW